MDVSGGLVTAAGITVTPVVRHLIRAMHSEETGTPMITHNEIVTVLGAALSLVVFMLGYWRGHYRAYAECCDCCTCETCTEDDASEPGWPDDGVVLNVRPEPDYLPRDVIVVRRPAVVLEPGPTIYPALAELAQDAMGEPESHPQPIESTWLRLQLVDWERRYPIPVGAP